MPATLRRDGYTVQQSGSGYCWRRGRDSLKVLRAGPAGLLAALAVFVLAACVEIEPGSDGQDSDPAAQGCPSGAYTRTTATVIRIVDGDTVEIECGFRVRYIGIDAPESVTPNRPVGCMGPEASARNGELVLGKTIRLEKDVSETDSFDRLLRYVYVDDAMINEMLVAEGLARSNRYPPDLKRQDQLFAAQDAARREGLGIWSAACTGPAATPGTSEGCDIKGNISASGDRVFHVPGQQDYAATVIDESRGEQWFCSEQEAINAGWRKASR